MAKSKRAARRRVKKPPKAVTARKAAAAKTAVTAAAAPNSPLPPIQCVIVLMQENRSFDHLFGNWPGVSGLAEGPFSNRPNPAAKAGAGNKAIAAGQPALFSVAQGQGPGHALDDTNVQLFTTKVVPSGAALE